MILLRLGVLFPRILSDDRCWKNVLLKLSANFDTAWCNADILQSVWWCRVHLFNFTTWTRNSKHTRRLKRLKSSFEEGYYGGYSMKRLKYGTNIVSVENSVYTISDILYIRQHDNCDGLFLYWMWAFGLKGSFDCGESVTFYNHY